MSEEQKLEVGTVMWRDLTVENAEQVRDFYSAVVGWKSMPLDMGGYDDYCMIPPGSESAVAGICHARGANANLPAQWLICITVDSTDEAAQRCVANGGKILDGPREAGGGQFCVIQDPAGAVAALYSKP